MKKIALMVSVLFIAMMLVSLVSAVSAANLSPDNMPALSIDPLDGIVVDDYDSGQFCGGYAGDGSTMNVTLEDGEHGKYLFADFDVKNWAGTWSRIGMSWDKGMQDWSKATVIGFNVIVNTPMTLGFYFKGADEGAEYRYNAEIKETGKWVQFQIPVEKFDKTVDYVGVVTDFNIGVSGTGQFGIDDIVAVGGENAAQ
jgi:opacity protein-like surface antigen